MPSSARSSRTASAMADAVMRGHGFGFPPTRRSTVLRRWVPVIASLIVQVPITVISVVSSEDFGLAGVVLVLLSVLGPALLFWVRRYPGPIVAVMAAAAASDFLLGYSAISPPYLALAFAIVIAISRGARSWTWISLIVVWEATLLAALLVGIALEPARIIVTTLGLLLVLGVAESYRRRREQFVQFQEAFSVRREAELQAERVRIARELHDVLAHSLSQINVQAGVGLHLMHKQPEQAEAALASIKSSSKDALDEVRSLLGMLRAEGVGGDGSHNEAVPPVPEPNLSRLPSLVESVRSQGLDVRFVCEVSAEAPTAVQLALYRIVQESLTNIVRHAHASDVNVSLRRDDGDYLVTIADNGIGFDGAVDREGRGLLGMRERAELLGGSLQVSRTLTGGALVTARIPSRQTSA
ncbi:sensor histidine kinase [Salinibacterium sp. M195]|uniref:sensor histidine kinase n=1 Tax=Salinibacterium sp. M195 TaxID=2583374 RepID=UPI001C6326A5|nr:sensor histidine kinase [Salinibacterium sp. M195]QYH35979.1 sensor histidine kinase [Salinibacterium sp. M195]